MTQPANRRAPRLVWRPEWTKEFEGYTVKYIKENIWRCDHIHTFDDLLQDAKLLFIKICYSYPRVIEPENFMALYKSALRNDICDKSRYKRRKEALEVHLDDDVSVDAIAGRIGEMNNNGYLNALLLELPDELHSVLLAMAQQDEKLEPRKVRTKLRRKENLSKRLARVLRLQTTTDPVRDLELHLT